MLAECSCPVVKTGSCAVSHPSQSSRAIIYGYYKLFEWLTRVRILNFHTLLEIIRGYRSWKVLPLSGPGN